MLWEVYPDQRFLQLLYNYILSNVEGDIFFVEDDEIETILLEKLKSFNNQEINEKLKNYETWVKPSYSLSIEDVDKMFDKYLNKHDS